MKQPPPTRFLASEYREHRPEYPRELFLELENRLKPFRLHQPRSLLDLGCGSGQSTESFLKTFSSLEAVTAVDPDPHMLHEAERFFSHTSIRMNFIKAKAEAVILTEKSFDAIIIGSAFHWMEPNAVIESLRTQENGFLFVFEYQFPRALTHLDLNAWVRKKFNSEWKAPQQTPRGSFKQLMTPLDDAFKRIHFHVPDWKARLSFEEFLGHLFSQSRYLHSETGLNHDEKNSKRVSVQNDLKVLWTDEIFLDFNFYLDAALYLLPPPMTTTGGGRTT